MIKRIVEVGRRIARSVREGPGPCTSQKGVVELDETAVEATVRVQLKCLSSRMRQAVSERLPVQRGRPRAG